MTVALEVLLVGALVIAALQSLAVWRHLRGGDARDPAITADTALDAGTPRDSGPHAPPVSILKPIAGLEDGLRDNLLSFFRLHYPGYELVFCFQHPSDPALPLVRELTRRHPEVDTQIVVGDYRAGLNPKVCNLIPGYRLARHGSILISDANVRVSPGYLSEAVSHLRDPDVGLVSHLVRGVGGSTLGADLDNGYLNSAIVGSVALLDRLGLSCVIGKSMLMRRSDLERMGGLESVQDHLAEDYILARRVRKAGRRVVISAATVDRVATRGGVRTFLRRYTRWNAMRRTIAGPLYALEPVTNPSLLAIILAGITLAGSGSERPTILLAGAGIGLKMALDACNHVLLGARLKPRHVFLTPLRDLLLAYAWAAGYWNRSVSWRGARVTLGRGTRLSVPEVRPTPAPLFPGEEPSTSPGLTLPGPDLLRA